MRILIIEDDSQLAGAIGDYLALQGCICDFAYHGTLGLQMAIELSFDVILLDLMMPKLDGLSVCQQLRAQGLHIPVLMLTACDTSDSELAGFRAGVDDYVVKPCLMPVLWARLQALNKRQHLPVDTLVIDQLTLYLKEHRVVRDGINLKLTPTGFIFLEILMRASPNVVTRQLIEEKAWPDKAVETNNFNVQLHQLRRTIDKPFDYPLIHTVVGVGLSLRKV
ncbi:MAG: response regulator transcription factor [Oceanospirillaceae bacterium]